MLIQYDESLQYLAVLKLSENTREYTHLICYSIVRDYRPFPLDLNSIILLKNTITLVLEKLLVEDVISLFLTNAYVTRNFTSVATVSQF